MPEPPLLPALREDWTPAHCASAAHPDDLSTALPPPSPAGCAGREVIGYLDARVASLRAYRAYLEGLGAGVPDPAEMLGWIASGSGARLGVDEALLFDVHVLVADGEPPWG